MRLYLAQHGLAVDKQDDPARPLSEAGVRDVRHVAQQLGEAGVQVARVWHSGKLRAEQTATLLAQQVLPNGQPEQTDGIAPNDSVEEFIADIDVWQEDTLVVGHLPFMARLVSRLVVGEMERECVRYTPGSIVCLEREAPEQWVLAWMLRPELHGSASQV
jgi:phosphohistidine phosphatase